MKILYIDCSMGAAGDMLTAALLELFPNPEAILEQLNSIGIPGVTYLRTPDRKNGILGTHISVRIGETSEEQWLVHPDAHEHETAEHHHHEHRSLPEIHNIISGLAVSETVKFTISFPDSLSAKMYAGISSRYINSLRKPRAASTGVQYQKYTFMRWVRWMPLLTSALSACCSKCCVRMKLLLLPCTSAPAQ